MIKAKTEDGYLICIPKKFHGYNCIKTIGYGCTSIVELVEDQNTGCLYSAKIISMKYITNKHITKSIEKEIAILDVVDHPSIIKMVECFEIMNIEKEIFIITIMEYCEKGELLSVAFTKKILNFEQKKNIFFQILKAVQYLHKLGISHGDIKAENILLTKNYNAKLCDFGFCRTTFIAKDESKFGTLYYAAPELYLTGDFDPFKSDIYAIGMTMYSIFELDFPLKSGINEFIIKQTLNGQFTFSKKMDKQLLDLIRHCLAFNPKKRPTIDEVLNHEFFDFCNHMCKKDYSDDKLKNNNMCSEFSSSSNSQSSKNFDENSYESVSIY